MLRYFLLLIVFVASNTYGQNDLTTFILVRHAEKEATPVDPKDPMLSKEGQERAQRLMTTLEKQKVDVILSTNFNRTRNTVKPFADGKGISVQAYESLKQPQLEELISKNKGGTILVAGHSNTIPALANLLLGKEQFKNYDDADYGNILIVTISSIGKGTVTHLRY